MASNIENAFKLITYGNGINLRSSIRENALNTNGLRGIVTRCGTLLLMAAPWALTSCNAPGLDGENDEDSNSTTHVVASEGAVSRIRPNDLLPSYRNPESIEELRRFVAGKIMSPYPPNENLISKESFSHDGTWESESAEIDITYRVGSWYLEKTDEHFKLCTKIELQDGHALNNAMENCRIIQVEASTGRAKLSIVEDELVSEFVIFRNTGN